MEDVRKVSGTREKKKVRTTVLENRREEVK